MASLSYDVRTGFLMLNTEYAYKDLCASCGFNWDSDLRSWVAVFTMSVVEEVQKKIPDVVLDRSVEERIPYQKKREYDLFLMRKDLTGENSVLNDVEAMKVQPFSFQKVGINYAIKNGKGMLFGCQMGCGKTSMGIGTAVELKRLRKITSCLVVTPASLKYNWPLEIEKFTNEKCMVVDGKDKDKRLAKWLDTSCFFKVVNYELLVKDIFDDEACKRKKNESEYDYAERARKHAYRRVKLLSVKNKIWDIAIFDEIHFCKHYSSSRHRACKALKAKVKIGLSGTPMDGRLEEIYNVMAIIAPGLLGSRDEFYNKYIITDLFGQVKGYRNIEQLKKTIAPFFIRRLKKDVLKQLPPKIYDTKIVSLTDEEMKYYDLIKDGKHVSVLVEDKLTHEMVSADPMVIAIRLKQFCNMPQFVEPKCKSHSKLDVFMEMMEELVSEDAHKAIIFSQYKEMVDVLDKQLRKAGYKFLRIDGDTDTKERALMQERFNTDQTIDCIIGTEAMSTGLNLIGADIVINYDDNWQPAIMSQRADRSNRIGQTKTCFIYSFICKDTIEERIRGVLYSKDKISSDVMGDDSDEAILRRLSKEEMRKVL